MKSWKVEDFDIQEQLGRGRFGIVYKAREKETGYIVALKMIPKGDIKNDSMKRQLTREVEVHSRLRHPSICRLYGYFQDQHCIFLVMEHCGTTTLFTHVYQNRELLPESEISNIIGKLLSAVAYISARCVMHRDIKLENVMLKDGAPKLIDFGWCVHSFGRRSTMCGTPEYLSPEMLSGDEYDSRLDVYTLGVVFYEMLFLRSPFFAEDNPGILKNIREGVLLFEGERQKISLEAKDLVTKMLTHNHLDRPRAIDLLTHPFVLGQKLQPETLQELKQQTAPAEPEEVKNEYPPDMFALDPLPQPIAPADKMEVCEDHRSGNSTSA